MARTEHKTKTINLSNHSYYNHFKEDRIRRRSRVSRVKNEGIIYIDEDRNQIYTGIYHNDCFHNIGTYKWTIRGEIYTYEGKFFANDMHGYGKLAYPSNKHFEGLFKSNKRFGPGVLTYPQGLQDVGLWNGNYLVRLSQTVSLSDCYIEHIPVLGKTFSSKLYLLQFKNIVPINNEIFDPAKEMLLSFNADDSALKRKNELYSDCIRNPQSLFFKQKPFHDLCYTDEEDYTVDVVDYFDDSNIPVMKKVTVTNLLAWNNELQNIEFMKHSFLNRSFEKLLSYRVPELLSGTKRSHFKDAGPLESISIKFLKACRENDVDNLIQIICEYDVYPDLSDSRGNNSITYATMNDRINIIKTLKNYGANINNFNDDCITPLIFALLHYISAKDDVPYYNWDYAFLPRKEEPIFDLSPETKFWPDTKTIISDSNSSSISIQRISSKGSSHGSKRFQQSDIDLNRDSKKELSGKSNSESEHGKTNTISRTETLISIKKIPKKRRRNTYYITNYVFDLSCIKSEPTPPVDVKTILTKAGFEYVPIENLKKQQGVTFVTTEIPTESDKLADAKQQEKIIISKTILTLLQCGANPNNCEVPFYPIILACFSLSPEILQYLITYKANIHVTTDEESGYLSPLHIITALPLNPALTEMAQILLENGANPDYCCNKRHWIEEREILLADEQFYEDYGKTPLHLLCMRYDFINDDMNILNDLAILLLQYGANVHIQYLGHSPLTLAMMRYNLPLMITLLDSGLINPNEILDNNMGVPLTIFTLRRYKKFVDPILINYMYEILLRYNANALEDIPYFEGNAVEFALVENINLQNIKKRSTYQKSIVEKPSPIIDGLKKCAEATLFRYTQSKAVKLLYKYKIQCGFESWIFENVVKFLTFERTENIIQVFLENKIISNNLLLCEMLLEYVKLKRPLTARSSVKTKKSAASSIKNPGNILNNLDYNTKIIQKQFYFENYIPELDPYEDKYRVCFRCYKKTNKFLILCPMCELVYFCSQQCNLEDVKNKQSKHLCKYLFYNNQLRKIKQGLPLGGQFEQMEENYIKLKSFLDKLDKMTQEELLELIKKREKQDTSGTSVSGSKQTDGKDSKRQSKTVSMQDKIAKSKVTLSKSDRTKDGSKSDRDKSEKEKLERDRLEKEKSDKDKSGTGKSDDEGEGKKSGKSDASGSKTLKSSHDFGDKKYEKIPISGKFPGRKPGDHDGKSGGVDQKDSKVCPGNKYLVTIGQKFTLDIEKRNIYLGKKLKKGECKESPVVGKDSKLTKLRDKLKSKFKIPTGKKDCTIEMLKLNELLGDPRPSEYQDYYSDIIEMFDFKFWQMFMPYCIYVDGQLYYKFEDLYYKFTYSSV